MKFLFAIISLGFIVNSFGQETKLPTWKINKSADFQINGKGDAAEWKQTAFTAIGKTKGNANYTTQLKFLYSDKGIYCLYVSEDSIITSTLREDFADIYNEDVVECFFWTDEQSTIYFEYELSPYNYELPILVPNHKGKFYGWRPWHYEGNRKTIHAATIQKENGKVKSWTAEFFIPYALLNPLQQVPPVKGTKWRANFYRIDYDHGITRWELTPIRTNFHDYERYGYLEFN
ncbi:MAG: carbohydrate-binding family 9-like protein [Chitinophagia bacterium]